MYRDDRPRELRIPTDRETAEEWGERIAVLRDAPPGWFVLLGRQSTNDYLCHLDLDYHLGREFIAIVQTSRPLPPVHRIGSVTTPESQLGNFLANSGRIDPRTMLGPLDTVTSTGELRLDGTPTPVEIHHSHGCRSALLPRLPSQQGYVIVTAPDEHWPAVTDLALASPSAF
ncbi:hypothetical protein GCM10018790_18760 [Kitasatospora xanthocidica]|uniref:hypothetical protein n=1 Tax=Kitasatospora xanthocidica TaxID=83382 RepID=UPI001673AD63|nr:hypothetical protein [Kitasatospora xanthocidica]GHF41370.1 hypothetical protein GCM10018790_18760 [Kitasatospora xanthocidica]